MSNGWLLIFLLLILAAMLAGCAAKPVETRIIEKPVPVYCTVKLPAECREAYAVDRVSPADDALTINRALRVEIEERGACEVRLRAALNGCNAGAKAK